MGASVAVFCSDGRFVYDVNAPEATRRAQLDAASAALPRDAFAPFSAAAWREVNERLPKGVPAGFPSDWCVPWPAPVHPNPPFPPNQPFSDTPALILSSDLDVVSLDATKAALPLFPQGHYVEVANAGHETAFWNACAAGSVRTFMATHATGDTSCAGEVNTPFHALNELPSSFVPYHGVARFPVEADDALPARIDPTGINHAYEQDRKVASVASSTVLDAFMHAKRMTGTSGQGRGLRGGSYTVTTSQTTTTIGLNAVRFTNDVTVTGHATRELATNTIDAQVTVEQTESQEGHGDPRPALRPRQASGTQAALTSFARGKQVARSSCPHLASGCASSIGGESLLSASGGAGSRSSCASRLGTSSANHPSVMRPLWMV